MIARLRIDPVSRGAGMTAPRVRERLVERLREQGIRDERVLTAIAAVPRHLFMDEALAARAYEDSALPIASGQTISQPWVVARMTELLLDSPVLPRKVLEIGTGSGYQAAVLAELGLEVHTVERIGRLLRRARTLLRGLGHTVRSRHDDGRAGWPELSPFDAILVSAGADAVEQGLLAQLAAHGTLVAPVGPANDQALVRIRGDGEGGWREERLQPVVFVPLLHGVVDA